MKIAALFRGPIRLEVDTHVQIIRSNYESIRENLECNIEPFLLTYTKPVKRRLERSLDFTSVMKIKEPQIEDRLFTAFSEIYKPFSSGHSRLNAFKQYYAMQQWTRYFNSINYDFTHVFYCRTDVALDICDKDNWLTNDGYSTAHAKDVNGPFTCDYVGSAPVDIFKKVWDTGNQIEIVEFLEKSNRAEDLLDFSIAKNKIKCYGAKMRFGGHIIRENEDWLQFQSKKQKR